MKSPEKTGGGGSGAKQAADAGQLLAAAKGSLRALRIQLNSSLALIPGQRATGAIDALGDSASATILCFSSSGRVPRAPFVCSRGSALATTAVNDHRSATRRLSVHLSVMNTEPPSHYGTSNCRNRQATVGGLTLTAALQLS